MKIFEHAMKAGITRTPEFERKTLATHAVNTGIICGHQCAYCSSRASSAHTPSSVRSVNRLLAPAAAFAILLFRTGSLVTLAGFVPVA